MKTETVQMDAISRQKPRQSNRKADDWPRQKGICPRLAGRYGHPRKDLQGNREMGPWTNKGLAL